MLVARGRRVVSGGMLMGRRRVGRGATGIGGSYPSYDRSPGPITNPGYPSTSGSAINTPLLGAGTHAASAPAYPSARPDVPVRAPEFTPPHLFATAQELAAARQAELAAADLAAELEAELRA